jgi:hypothetical protein
MVTATSTMAITDRPLTSLQSVILITGPLVFLWSYLRQYISRNGPPRNATQLKTINSAILAISNIALGYLILNDILHFHDQPALPFSNNNNNNSNSNSIFAPIQRNLALDTKRRLTTDDLGYLFHISKIYAYTHLYLLIALGQPIPSSMAFEHLTSPFLTYFRVLNGSEWHWFVLLACVHNVLVYGCDSFEGLLGMRLGWLNPLVMATEWMQLAVATGNDALYLVTEGREGKEVTERGIAMLLWVRYGMLSWKEREDARKKIGKGREEEAGKKNGDGKVGEAVGRKRKSKRSN